MKPKRLNQTLLGTAVTLAFSLPLLIQPVSAANTSHTLTTTGANNLSTATWTGGAPTNLTIGDMAIYATATTASTTTIDINTTLGGFRTNNTGVWTIASGAGVLTLNATGLTAGNSPFANAGVAFLANTAATAGGLTVNSAISMANTNLDIGTTAAGSTLIGGAITATTAQNLNFRANGAGAITDSAAIGASGSNIAISNLGTSTGLTTLSGALGASVASVTQNSATSALTLSGANGSFTGPVNLTAGTLNIGNAAALGTGTLTISAGTTINTSGGVQTLSGNNAQTWNGNFTFTGSSNLTFGTGAVTLGTNVTITGSAQTLAVNGAIGDGGSGFSLTKIGGGNMVLAGANTYTGATTIGTASSTASGGTVTVNGTAGSIVSSSGVAINGSSRLLLDNTAGNVDRVKDAGNVNMTLGGELSLTGNATTNATETVTNLGVGTGSSIITVTSAANRVTTLAASGSLSRTNNGTALVRGTSLNQSAATNVSRITLGTAPTGADFVGTNTLTGGATNDATQALKIVPWLIGDTAVAGSGSNFVTYDSTLGLRVLTTAEQTTLAAGSTTAASPVNAIAFNGTVATSGLTVNSLLFSTATQTLNGSGALTVNSGAIAATATNEVIGSGFSSLALGNGEGVITTTGANTLTVNTGINVTSSGGLTKAGAGTLILGASNLYTGVTTVNQGTLQIGTGTAGDLGSNTANIVLNGGTLSFARTNAGLTIANNISGIGAVTQNGVGGTTALSGNNTYSGATNLSAGTLQFLALPGNTTAGVSSASSANSALTLAAGTTLQLRGDSSVQFNTGAITTPAAGVSTAVTFDVGTNGAATSGNVYTLGGVFNPVSVNGGALGTTNSVTFNITDSTGNNSFLSVGAIQLTTSGNNGNFFINPTTGNLILAGLTGSASNATVTTFQGSGTTTVTGSIQQGSGRTIALNMNQTGTVNLNGVNTNGTTFNLNSGTTVVNSNSGLNGTPNLGTTTATANNVTLLLGGTNATGTVAGTNGGITVANALSVRDTDTGTLTLGGQNTSGTNTFSNTITLGATTNTGKDVTLQAATGGQVNFTGNIVINGTGAVSKGGITVGSAGNAGTVRLAGNNTYGGVTTLANGTLLADSAQALNTTVAGGNVTFTGGTLKLGSTFNAGANADISARIKNSTGAVSIDTNGLNRSFGSAIDDSNTGGLTKLGTGTLTLTGTNTYTGATTINAGTLAVNGSLAAGSAVAVNNGGTLGGSGTVGGAVTVNSGGVVGPGNSPGVLTTGSATFNSGSVFSWELNSNAVGTRGTNYDGLTTTGNLSAASGAIFRVVLTDTASLSDTFWSSNQTWTNIFSVGGTTTLADTGLFNTFQVYDSSGTDITSTLTDGRGFTMTGTTLNWNAVPEPTSALAGLLLGAGLLRRRRVA